MRKIMDFCKLTDRNIKKFTKQANFLCGGNNCQEKHQEDRRVVEVFKVENIEL